MRKKMKILTAGMLAAVMTLSNIPMEIGIQKNRDVQVYAAGENEYVVGNTTYTYEVMKDGTISIKDCNTSDTKLEIPGEISGKKVTSIGYEAFYGCSSLTEIKIPSTVTTLGSYVFYDCDSLKEVEIPDNVKGRLDCCFKGCDNLGKIKIGKGITTIGSNSFNGLKNLHTVELSEGLETIEYQAFQGSGITQIKIPSTVKTIGSYAFANCGSPTIYGYPNTEAERYANANGITFVNLEEEPNSSELLYGDANNDGVVNSADAVLIKKYLAGYRDLAISEEACDVNLDGAVTSADAVLVLKKLAGYDIIFGA